MDDTIIHVDSHLLLKVGPQIANPLMFDHNPLRLPCRSGCIDYIGQIVGLRNVFQIRSVFMVDGSIVQREDTPAISRLIEQMFLNQQKLGSRILQHKSDPFFRIFGIDRNVSAAGF
ncbi:hypothetical protein D3C73_850480 [compost metagenome]